MSKPNILVQLDVDAQPSVFDGVVAVDAEVSQLFRHGAVEPSQVRNLVHGTIFTRGPKDLHHTAIFVGGSDVNAAETIFAKVKQSFLGPLRVSVLFDANGANTTAAAAVLTAAQHVELGSATATVLAATGPVGQRAVRMLACAGTRVRVASRKLERAEAVCRDVNERVSQATLTPLATSNQQETAEAIIGSEIVIAAGAAGIELVTVDTWKRCTDLRVAIDLNAVPPVGLAPVETVDSGTERDNILCYGAIGVGGLKMKIHKAAIRSLFASNDRILDAEEIFSLGQQIQTSS